MLKHLNLSGQLRGENIVFDAQGGERGLEEMMQGIFDAASGFPGNIIVVGNREELDSQVLSIKRKRFLEGIAPWLYTYRFHSIISNIITLDAKVAAPGNITAREVLKNKSYSINRAMHVAKSTDAIGVISPGSTAATVASATYHFNRIHLGWEGEKKVGPPPLAAPIRKSDGYTILLDIGANKDCKPEQLLEFAILGASYYQALFQPEEPVQIGLLNIGTEKGKGNLLVKEAYKIMEQQLPKMDLEFYGNCEPSHIFTPTPDVVVADGFTGNVTLKSLETGARQVGKNIRERGRKVWHVPAILYLNLVGFFGRVMQDMKDSDYGAAAALGLDKFVMVAHGTADRSAVKNAILRMYADKDLIERITDNARTYYQRLVT